ncbi:CurL C-terminal domain-containing protein [Streptomyces olivaceoviridis]
MEGAAGVGGIIKTVLQLREKTIFPHLNFVTPPVSPGGTPPSPSVTGIIASIVLERHRPQPSLPNPLPTSVPARPSPSPPRAASRCAGLAERHLDHLAHTPDLAVADLCRTSNTGRAHFRYRMVEVVHDRESALRALRKRIAGPGTAEHHGRRFRCPQDRVSLPGYGDVVPGHGYRAVPPVPRPP